MTSQEHFCATLLLSPKWGLELLPVLVLATDLDFTTLTPDFLIKSISSRLFTGQNTAKTGVQGALVAKPKLKYGGDPNF